MDKTIINIDGSTISQNDIVFWKNPADNTNNAIITFNDTLTRLRAGLIVIKDGTKILLGEEADEPGEFSLPGGGLEPGESPESAAKREAEEEVFIRTKNVRQTGHNYCECHDELKDWVRENVPENYQWYNYYTCLCIGEYAGEFTGEVEVADLDHSMHSTAKFYNISDVLDNKSFKLQWKKALFDAGYIKRRKVEPKLLSNLALLEDTRTAFISKSKNVDAYKHNIRGKNRWERKKYSKVANQTQKYNTINMNDFFKKDLLEVNIPVTGETGEYVVTLNIDGVVAEIARNIKLNHGTFEYRTVIQALTKIFNTSNIKVNCTCDDFKYHYLHNLIINNNSTKGTDSDPGPGKTGMTAEAKGQGCKHILLVLSNQDWLMKVANVIKNYITYMAEHKKALFNKFIFPKLYGLTPEEAKEEKLLPEETKLESGPSLIDEINKWARNRGKFQKGSNKNPVTGTGGKPKKDTNKENPD